ncbi:MAG: spore cortex biosynthesis protein YabQ [Clostridia bacterium]
MDIVASQSFEFIVCLAVGGLVALLYNALWLARYLADFNKFITFIIDILFGAQTLIIVFFTSRLVCYGKLQIFHIVALLLGYCCFNYVFSNFLRKYIIQAGKLFVRLLTRLKASKLFGKIFK